MFGIFENNVDKAQKHLNKATKLSEQGEYIKGICEFEKAFKLTGDMNMIYFIAYNYDRLGHPDRVEFYFSYVVDNPLLEAYCHLDPSIKTDLINSKDISLREIHDSEVKKQEIKRLAQKVFGANQTLANRH